MIELQTDVLVGASTGGGVDFQAVQFHTALDSRISLDQVAHPLIDRFLKLAGRKSVVDQAPVFRPLAFQSFR